MLLPICDVYVELSDGATWTLTGDSYIKSLTCGADAIDLAGHTLYVDGKAYEAGTESQGEAIEVEVSEQGGAPDGQEPPQGAEGEAAPEEGGQESAQAPPEGTGGERPGKPSGDHNGTPPEKPSGEKPSGNPPEKPANRGESGQENSNGAKTDTEAET